MTTASLNSAHLMKSILGMIAVAPMASSMLRLDISRCVLRDLGRPPVGTGCRARPAPFIIRLRTLASWLTTTARFHSSSPLGLECMTWFTRTFYRKLGNMRSAAAAATAAHASPSAYGSSNGKPSGG
jgi:hypothetical protein